MAAKLKKLQDRLEGLKRELAEARRERDDALGRITELEDQYKEELGERLAQQERDAEGERKRAVEEERQLWKDLWSYIRRRDVELEERVAELEEHMDNARTETADASTSTSLEEPVARTGDKRLGEETSAASGKDTVPEDLRDVSRESQVSSTESLPLVGTTEGSSVPAAWLPQHLPPLPQFKGEGQQQGEDAFEEWIEQLELVAALLKWDESMRLVHLITRLGGQARAFYRSCPPEVKESYPRLVAELRKRFKPVRLPAVQTSLFHKRRQQEGETVDVYAQDLRRLFYQAYPSAEQGTSEAESMGKSVLSNQFVAGLIPDIQQKLAGVSGTLEELLCKARFEEAKRRELSTSGWSRKEGKTSAEPDPQPKHSQTGTGKNNRHRDRQVRQQTCNGCGSPEHFIRNCPLTRRVGGKETTFKSETKVNGLDVAGTDQIEQELAVMKSLGAQAESGGLHVGPRWETDVMVDNCQVRALMLPSKYFIIKSLLPGVQR